MIIAERTDIAVPVGITLTKFGLETGATINVSAYDELDGTWLDFDDDSWQATPTTKTKDLVETDTGRYTSTINPSSAASSSTHFHVYYNVTAGGQGADGDVLVLTEELYTPADQATADLILGHTSVGGPGPWTTASGNPVIANPIIDAINAQTTLLLECCSPSNECSSTPILPVIYTGHKGDNLITPVYRNGTLMPDSELANGTQFSMTIRNITTDTAYNVTDVVFAGTGHLSYRTKAADGIFETAGKWEYQSDGLTEQGAPFESTRLTVRVYDDV